MDITLFNKHIVYLSLKQNVEIPYFIHGDILALIVYDKLLQRYLLSHPYNIKEKYVISGLSNFDINDIIDIRFANQEDVKIWLDNYKIFHDSIIVDKGYDICEIDLSTIKNL